MNTKFQLLTVAIAFSGLVATTQVQAAPNAVNTVPYPAASNASVAAPGPEADPYLQHYHGTGNSRYQAVYWSQFQVDWAHVDNASIAPPGPEADLYLQHYSGSASGQYGAKLVQLHRKTN